MMYGALSLQGLDLVVCSSSDEAALKQVGEAPVGCQ